MLVAEHPVPGHHVPSTKHTACIRQVCSWAKICRECGIAFLLIGSLGAFAQNSEYEVMVTDGFLHKRYHHLCHFDLHVDSAATSPSKSALISYCDRPLTPHPCCGRPRDDHVLDWNHKPHPSQGQVKARVIGQIGKVLLTELVSKLDCKVDRKQDVSSLGLLLRDESSGSAPDLTTPILRSEQNSTKPPTTVGTDTAPASSPILPDVLAKPVDKARLCAPTREPSLPVDGFSLTCPSGKANAFPTDSRERAKAAEKLRKEQGIEPRRKKFHIEDHFDDCGTDLSGLGSDLVLHSYFCPSSVSGMTTDWSDVWSESASDDDSSSGPPCFLLRRSDAVVYPVAATNTSGPESTVCSKCSSENLPAYKHCMECGHDLVQQRKSEAEQELAEAWRKCPGCLHRCAKTDPKHNRIANICKYPLTQEIKWKCPGCIKHANISHDSHTYEYGKCKWAETEDRMQGKRRKGKHPRPPAQAPARCPTASARAQQEDGTDFQQAGSVENPDDVGSSHPSAAPSGSAAPKAASSAPGAAAARTRAARFKNASTGPAPTRTDDWTRFDVTTSLRHLRSKDPNVVIRELRKLHLRWWHATPTNMHNILHAAGVTNSVLELIPNIVKTCRECAKWTSPGNDTVASITLPTAFNEHVECDLLFYRQHIVLHCICRCTRWHAGKEISAKTTEVLLVALVDVWIGLHGPMLHFHVDGESGLYNEEAAAFFKRRVIQVHVRAPGQHARYIERHGAITRAGMHIMEEALKKDGVEIAFPMF